MLCLILYQHAVTSPWLTRPRIYMYARFMLLMLSGFLLTVFVCGDPFAEKM
uniref:Uncharacterized protein n=1 Tax=Arundo donax TaxID=35708 RepID=A0A0A9C579_ARUDO